MPRSASRDIDSLPYHALQAEAARYSIRRNLGSAKLKIAIKKVQETGDTKALPREWLTAIATEPSEPASTLVTNSTNRLRKIASRPNVLGASQRQPSTKDRAGPIRTTSRTVKKTESVIPDPEKTTHDRPSAHSKSDKHPAGVISTSLPSSKQPASAGPSVQECHQREALTSSINVQAAHVDSSTSELETAICHKALEMGIMGGVPPRTIQCLITVTCEVLNGILSGTAAEVVIQNVLEQHLIAHSGVIRTESAPRGMITSSDDPISTSICNQLHQSDWKQHSGAANGRSPGPRHLIDNGDPSESSGHGTSTNDQDSPPPVTPAPEEELFPSAQTSQGSLRRTISEVENVEKPPMKKSRIGPDASTHVCDQPGPEPIDVKSQSSDVYIELHEDMTVKHTSLSPINEDSQVDSAKACGKPDSVPGPATSLLTSNDENTPHPTLVLVSQSSLATNIFSSDANHGPLFQRPSKAIGPPSPLSKPTLYGTEHMYGHSTAPFGELYDNTDMTFIYELADSGASKRV